MFPDNGPFFIYIKLKIPVLKVSQLLSEIQQKKILVNILMAPDSNVFQCTPKSVNITVINLIFKMLAQLNMCACTHKHTHLVMVE